MSEWRARRFWTRVSSRPADGGWEVFLDDRPLRTPGKLALLLPTEALAEAIASEWDAQQDVIAPDTMPLTRAANSAIERVRPHFAAVADMLAEYGGTDLLSYRADDPPELARRQAEAWDPLIDWAATALKAPLRVTLGIVPVGQDSRSLATLRGRLDQLDDFGLTALHDLVTLPGSLVLGLAVIEGRLPVEQAFALSRIDEDYQIERWGQDDEARAAADARLVAMQSAHRLWTLSRSG